MRRVCPLRIALTAMISRSSSRLSTSTLGMGRFLFGRTFADGHLDILGFPGGVSTVNI